MKKTKKNTILRLAVLLFALTLLSTGLLGGTLAKYVTKYDSVNDTARVAKWGVEITADTTNTLFKTEYYAVEGEDYTGLSVQSSSDNTTDYVLAPGTSGKLVAFEVTGSPEVASRLDFTDNGSELSEDWLDADGSNAYEPVKWTFKVGSETIVDEGTFAELKEGFTNEKATANFEPNTDLSTGLSYEISWEWPFEDDDVNDTYLGNLSTAPTITLDFDITLTQID